MESAPEHGRPHGDEAIRAIWEARASRRESAGPRVIRALQLELASKDYAFQRRDEKLGAVQHQLQPQQGA
jgi:hypothetical protein